VWGWVARCSETLRAETKRLGRVIRAGVLAAALVEILVCPRSKQPLIYFPKGEANTDESQGMLVCPQARLRYRIEDGVPILLVTEAEELSPAAATKLVERARELGLHVPPSL
jgi:uncharacterized protein